MHNLEKFTTQNFLSMLKHVSTLSMKGLTMNLSFGLASDSESDIDRKA